MTDRKIAFWDADETAEELHHKTQADAIEAYIENAFPDRPTGKVKLHGYARMEVAIPTWAADTALETLLETLGEDYDPNGEFDTPTKKMKEIASRFVADVVKEYVSWCCEPVTTEEVDLPALEEKL